MNERFDLGASIVALKVGEVVGRRNYEGYRVWAKLERDWIEPEELEHLQRATVFMKQRNRSLNESLERTKNPMDDSKPPEKMEPANLTEMIRELRDLRTVSETSRQHQVVDRPFENRGFVLRHLGDALAPQRRGNSGTVEPD